jgi:hypothetical protein
MAGPLTISPERRDRVQLLGHERQPLLILDDCLADPAGVLAIAARATFAKNGPHYPGIRAAVPQAAAAALIEPLGKLLAGTFDLAKPPEFAECYLSLVTTPAQALQPIQRLPHFDGLEPDRLAFLLYLDRAERGGTAFYRQRGTGFETVDAARFAEFQSSLERGIAQHGLPPSDYIRGDTGLYEQVGKVCGRFNRAVAYRGNSLHCADLPAGFEPQADPLSGRLTLNLFLRVPD